MNDQLKIRDERTVSVENASYKIGFIMLSFGVLLILSVRGLVLHQAYWDLFALVMVSSWVAVFYQSTHQVRTASWRAIVAVILIGAVFGGVIVGLVLVLSQK